MPTTGSDLEHGALQLIETVSESYGITLAADAMVELQEMVHDGLARMAALQHDGDLERIHEAQTNLTHFIYRLAVSARQAGTVGVERADVQRERSSRYCPVYPFS